MTFDKSKVYTALNADELLIGSKCIFADTIQDLRQIVQDEDAETYVETLTNLYDDDNVERFAAGCFTHIYAYLIEPPAEPKYKPFTNLSSLVSGTNKHYVYIKSKKSVIEQIVGMTLNNDVVVDGQNGRHTISAKDLLENYVFERDGSPCGELVEE